MDFRANALRQRFHAVASSTVNKATLTANDSSQPTELKGPLGRTPNGKVFRIPQTHNMISSLFDPRLPKSYVDILTLSLLSLQVALFLLLPRDICRAFFMIYFGLWRIAYDVGLGILLRKQSEQKWIVKKVNKYGWMDNHRRPAVRRWIIKELQAKMGKDYNFDSLPLEYNVWILFRHFVDVILLNDFLSYCFFAVSFLQFPINQSAVYHVLRWVGGFTLILFNLWVKVDAHRIVKDFAWYWGDAFFLTLQDLVFDGVFEFAPHPMYSVGYAGYYGLSLIVYSQVVLFVSIAAHACQFGFLIYFENPHIERTYGVRKPLAARTPLNSHVSIRPAFVNVKTLERGKEDSSGQVEDENGTATPSLTTSAGSDTDCDTNDEENDTEMLRSEPLPKLVSQRTASDRNNNRCRGTAPPFPPTPRPPTTRHDLDNHYFRNDLTLLKNFDFFRARDLAFALVVMYSGCCLALPSLSNDAMIVLAFGHALTWRIFHTVVLGLALKAQSERRWIVRHFLKHYHYEAEGGAADEAFSNWKSIYNLSLCMSYASFGALAWRCYRIPSDWTVGSQLLRHVLGLLLISIHVWAAQSTYDVLGPFGWFYGDFFIEDYPAELYYTGIFRFLNNPERSMGGAAFFGLVLICGSKLLLFQAVVAVLCHWWFLSFVENPHMQKLYGGAVRKDAGITKTIRTVAARNAHVLGGVTRSVKEVQGSFEKVFEETADAVEDFLNRSGPRLSGYVEDTKILLKQSGERLVISRIATDLARYDQSRYSLVVQPSSSVHIEPFSSTDPPASLRFHLGQSINVYWQCPTIHSRKDWIGVYRLGANQSRLVSRISSQGHWVGVHDDEWEGDHYDGPKELNDTSIKKFKEKSDYESGCVEFSGKRLPWKIGFYEFRYHHNGKHSVMAIAAPIEIYVEQAENPNDAAQVSVVIATIVRYQLGGPVVDNICPPTAQQSKAEVGEDFDPHSPNLCEPGDFAIYTMEEAEHIAYAIQEAFGVELASEVVIAAANVDKLAGRVIESRRLTERL